MTTIVDGSNGVSFPYGATQSTGAGPAFSATSAGTQTIALATLTLIQFGTENFDTNSNFASNTFTPTVAGYYQINSMLWASATTATWINAFIYKNGVSYSGGPRSAAFSGTSASSNVSDIVYCNGSTDYIQIYGIFSGSGTVTMNVASYFSGCLIRGA